MTNSIDPDSSLTNGVEGFSICCSGLSNQDVKQAIPLLVNLALNEALVLRQRQLAWRTALQLDEQQVAEEILQIIKNPTTPIHQKNLAFGLHSTWMKRVQ
jgi:hypothetical protein